MPYRTTRRTAEARQRQIAAMARGREAARLARPYVAYDPNYPEMFHFAEVPEFEAFSVVAFPGRFPDYQKPRLPVIAWSARRQQVVLIGN